jgi:hypothetical protein
MASRHPDARLMDGRELVYAVRPARYHADATAASPSMS